MSKQDRIEEASGLETTGFERRSLLDPHLSVLELLERTCDAQRVDGGNENANKVSGGASSISNSWHAIHRNELMIPAVPERCPSQAGAVGVLSSSDTSEEEADPASSPNVAQFSQFHQPQQPPRYQFKLDVPVMLPSTDQNHGNQVQAQDNDEEGDNETLTKTLSNSSNSFVMPKLSLSQKSHKLRILILGRPGFKFYQSIPKRYQHFFELSRLQEPLELKQFTGILIVFQELKEMVSLLNRVCQCASTRPVIPVCQTGQHQQVRIVLESLLKSKLISLLYPPVVISNHSDLNNMYRFLLDLSKTISDNSEDEEDEEEREPVDKKLKKSHQRKKKRMSSHDKTDKPRKRRSKDTRLNKWVVWGISLTVGVGVGYCMSYFASSGLISMSAKSIASIDGCRPNNNVVVFDDSSLHMGEYEHDLENPFARALLLFKQTLKQWNWAIKQFIAKHLHLAEPLSSANYKEWTAEDNSNRVLALGYILL